jgi:hypothetical protein
MKAGNTSGENLALPDETNGVSQASRFLTYFLSDLFPGGSIVWNINKINNCIKSCNREKEDNRVQKSNVKCKV